MYLTNVYQYQTNCEIIFEKDHGQGHCKRIHKKGQVHFERIHEKDHGQGH